MPFTIICVSVVGGGVNTLLQKKFNELPFIKVRIKNDITNEKKEITLINPNWKGDLEKLLKENPGSRSLKKFNRKTQKKIHNLIKKGEFTIHNGKAGPLDYHLSPKSILTRIIIGTAVPSLILYSSAIALNSIDMILNKNTLSNDVLLMLQFSKYPIYALQNTCGPYGIGLYAFRPILEKIRTKLLNYIAGEKVEGKIGHAKILLGSIVAILLSMTSYGTSRLINDRIPFLGLNAIENDIGNSFPRELVGQIFIALGVEFENVALSDFFTKMIDSSGWFVCNDPEEIKTLEELEEKEKSLNKKGNILFGLSIGITLVDLILAFAIAYSPSQETKNLLWSIWTNEAYMITSATMNTGFVLAGTRLYINAVALEQMKNELIESGLIEEQIEMHEIHNKAIKSANDNPTTTIDLENDVMQNAALSHKTNNGNKYISMPNLYHGEIKLNQEDFKKWLENLRQSTKQQHHGKT